jgi:hypothetical protein
LLFLGLFSCGFSLLFFSSSGFHLLSLFDFSALELLLQLLLTAGKLCEVLLRDFCLDSCDLLLLPNSHSCQPVKALPHKASQLL